MQYTATFKEKGAGRTPERYFLEAGSCVPAFFFLKPAFHCTIAAFALYCCYQGYQIILEYHFISLYMLQHY
jgi:hypothetical protein